MLDGTAGALSVETRVRSLAAPLLDDLGVELEDVQWGGGRLRVVVDTPDGIDSETLVLVTRTVSAELDTADPIPSGYMLEVTSPGIERPLRHPEQYRKAIGSDIAVKLLAGVEGERRLKGRLVAADDERIMLEGADGQRHEVPLATVERARTVFDWGRSGPRRSGERSGDRAQSRGGPGE